MGKYIQDSCKTSNDVRCRDVGSEESTREEVGCGGNEDVKMDEYRVTKLDRIRNEIITGTTKVREISKKVQESRLKRYGHVLRREDEYEGKRVMGMEVPGERMRGRPKRRWLDSIRNDLSERELSGEDAQDRAKWRRLIKTDSSVAFTNEFNNIGTHTGLTCRRQNFSV